MFIAAGVAVALFLIFLVVGAVTGRVKMKSCCAIADPRDDMRMRAAFIEASPGRQSEQTGSDMGQR